MKHVKLEHYDIFIYLIFQQHITTNHTKLINNSYHYFLYIKSLLFLIKKIL